MAACCAIVCVVAYVQMTWVIGLRPADLQAPLFTLPVLVGVLFSVLPLWLRRTQHALAEQSAALASEQARTANLHAHVAELAAERQTMLEHAHEALLQHHKAALAGTLAGQIAHDLNGLLTVIAQVNELVREQAHDPGDLDSVDYAVDRAARLSRRLLRLIRQGATASPDLVQVDDVLGQLHPVLSHLAAAHVVRHQTGAQHRAWVSPAGLELAVLNLVGNARDAAPEGSEIVVRTHSTEAGVTIDVVDRGTGLTPAALARATEPLFTTKGEAGNGLGLTIVQDVASSCGGSFELCVTPGGGTTARLFLPTSAPAAHPSA